MSIEDKQREMDEKLASLPTIKPIGVTLTARGVESLLAEMQGRDAASVLIYSTEDGVHGMIGDEHFDIDLKERE